MKTSVAPRADWISLSRLMIAACTETSSAETGSSATITSGSPASARAIAARQVARLAESRLAREPHHLQQPRDTGGEVARRAVVQPSQRAPDGVADGVTRV